MQLLLLYELCWFVEKVPHMAKSLFFFWKRNYVLDYVMNSRSNGYRIVKFVHWLQYCVLFRLRLAMRLQMELICCLLLSSWFSGPLRNRCCWGILWLTMCDNHWKDSLLVSRDYIRMMIRSISFSFRRDLVILKLRTVKELDVPCIHVSCSAVLLRNLKALLR